MDENEKLELDENETLYKQTSYKKFKEKHPKIASIFKKTVKTAPTVLPLFGATIAGTISIATKQNLPDTFASLGIATITGGVVGNGLAKARESRKNKNSKALAKAYEELNKKKLQIEIQEKILQSKQQELLNLQREKDFFLKKEASENGDLKNLIVFEAQLANTSTNQNNTSYNELLQPLNSSINEINTSLSEVLPPLNSSTNPFL